MPIFRRLLLAGILSIGFCIEYAIAADPSRDKCTCDPVRNTVADNGAWVKDAASCWSTEYRDRQWCDITIDQLEGTNAHQQTVSAIIDSLDSADPSSLAKIIRLRFNAYVKTTAADGDASPQMLAKVGVVVALIDKNQQMIAKCATNFRDWMSGKRGFEPIVGSNFLCRVGESSGWLLIEFDLSDLKIVYRVAPKNGT